MTHFSDERSLWRVDNQRKHNEKVLDILNTASAAMMERLPGIGPKTAISIHTYR